MKRIFLSAIMLATAYTLCAQDQPYMATDVNPGTYTAPVIIQTKFQTNYPNATMVTWQPMSDWWYATYKDNNNRLVSVYYNTQPYYLIRDEVYTVSLPVLNSFVPDDVVTNAVNTYGASLYSITALKPDVNNNTAYEITLVKNGKMEMATMNANGTVYVAPVNSSNATVNY